MLIQRAVLLDGTAADVRIDERDHRIIETVSGLTAHRGERVLDARGGTVIPGLEMLIYQAVEQVRHFTGLGGAVTAEVIDVMCDAVGAPRRVF